MKQMPLLTRNFVFVFILVYLVAGLVSLIQLLKYNYRAIHRNSILENKILEGQLILKEKELHYLKEQIHPHFLFNTLNTIYGAALKEAKHTPDLILKLSNLLDYSLNQIKKKKVAITEEVAYIDSYIGLEQVRFRDTLEVDFTKNIQQDIEVPPMLFIAFVENAFKHGGLQNDLLTININLKVTKDLLHFAIKNTVKNTVSNTANHGLGIENSKKRLDVLYPNLYTLTSKIEENWFYLDLYITLP